MFPSKHPIQFIPMVAFAVAVHAQGTNVTCLPGYSWMTNSRGQSPCLVTSYLNGMCSPDPTHSYLMPLPNNSHYTPPANTTACTCSSVLYAAISACATCQGDVDGLVPWSGWTMKCAIPYLQMWPKDIPVGTAIPVWAYLDVKGPDTFNATLAQKLAEEDLPDSTAVPGMTQTSTPSPSALSTSHGSKVDRKAAAVGSALGGVLLIVCVVSTVAFVRRIRRSKQSSTSDTSLAANLSQYPGGGELRATRLPSSLPRRYDPNNPSTFPPEILSPPRSAKGLIAPWEDASAIPPTHHCLLPTV